MVASPIWSLLTSSTSINKLQIMQNAALITATGCTQDTNIQICMTKRSYFPYTSTYSSTIQTENTTSITPLTQTHNILQHSKLKNTIFYNSRYTTNIPTYPYTVSTTYKQINMCHIHKSIVSMHLATRDNNKILHNSTTRDITPPHPAPRYPFCNTHTTHIISSTAPTYTPHCHPWIYGQNPLEWRNCWQDGRRSWLVDHKREGMTTLTSKGHGSG